MSNPSGPTQQLVEDAKRAREEEIRKTRGDIEQLKEKQIRIAALDKEIKQLQQEVTAEGQAELARHYAQRGPFGRAPEREDYRIPSGPSAAQQRLTEREREKKNLAESAISTIVSLEVKLRFQTFFQKISALKIQGAEFLTRLDSVGKDHLGAADLFIEQTMAKLNDIEERTRAFSNAPTLAALEQLETQVARTIEDIQSDAKKLDDASKNKTAINTKQSWSTWAARGIADLWKSFKAAFTSSKTLLEQNTQIRTAFEVKEIDERFKNLLSLEPNEPLEAGMDMLNRMSDPKKIASDFEEKQRREYPDLGPEEKVRRDERGAFEGLKDRIRNKGNDIYAKHHAPQKDSRRDSQEPEEPESKPKKPSR